MKTTRILLPLILFFILANFLLPGQVLAAGKLINISTNGYVSDFGLRAGFIIEGDEPRRVVVIGEQFESNIDPVLKLTDFNGDEVYFNDNWQDDPTADEVVSTLERAPGREVDAAFAITLDPGVYIARLESGNDQNGNGIVAVNDFEGENALTRLINISTNGYVSDFGLRAGFIIEGDAPRRVVVLGERFESDIDPFLTLTDFNGDEVYSNDNWLDDPTAREVESTLGRTLGTDIDAGFAVTLDPGVYIVHLESRNRKLGDGIVAINDIIPEPVVSTDSETIKASTGGDLELSDGTRLSILPSGISTDRTISIKKIGSDFGVNNGTIIFNPSGLGFNIPANLFFPRNFFSSGLRSDFPIYSSNAEDILTGNELAKIDFPESNFVGEELKLQIEHFSILDYSVPKMIYLIFGLPRKYLKMGDIQYHLSSYKDKVGWLPGHAGIYVGTENPESAEENNPDDFASRTFVQSLYSPEDDIDSVIIENAHDFSEKEPPLIYMGAKRRKNITWNELQKVARFALDQEGAPYTWVGNSSEDGYSCVGLIEAAYEHVDKNIVANVPVVNAVIPSIQYRDSDLKNVNEISVIEGEQVSFEIYGVKRIINLIDLDTHEKISANVIDELPDGASYDQDSYIFTFDTSGKSREKPWEITFKATNSVFSEKRTLKINVIKNEVTSVDHELSVTKDGQGKLTSSPTGIDCGVQCSQTFEEGTTVELTAEPDPGWNFTGWSGACSGTDKRCTVTMDADESIHAQFEQQIVSNGNLEIFFNPSSLHPAYSNDDKLWYWFFDFRLRNSGNESIEVVAISAFNETACRDKGPAFCEHSDSGPFPNFREWFDGEGDEDCYVNGKLLIRPGQECGTTGWWTRSVDPSHPRTANYYAWFKLDSGGGQKLATSQNLNLEQCSSSGLNLQFDPNPIPPEYSVEEEKWKYPTQMSIRNNTSSDAKIIAWGWCKEPDTCERTGQDFAMGFNDCDSGGQLIISNGERCWDTYFIPGNNGQPEAYTGNYYFWYENDYGETCGTFRKLGFLD